MNQHTASHQRLVPATAPFYGACAERGTRHSLFHVLVVSAVVFFAVLVGSAHAAKPPQKPRPDNQPPTVTITSPASGSTVRGSVVVSVNASDNTGITRVDLLVNGASVATTNVAPYTFNWNSSTIADGSVTLMARAYDSAGNAGSGSVNVTVANSTNADTSAPSVSITSPTAGSVLKGTVAVNVTAADNVGVSRVELRANGALVGTVTTAPYSFSWNSASVPDGSVVLTAAAFDAAGNNASTAVNDTVLNASTSTSAPSSLPTLSVTSTNAASSVAVRVYPADTSGSGDGTATLTRTYSVNTRVWLSAALRSGNNYFIKWQKDGVDYDRASTTSVVMDANHTLSAVYETPSCTGVPVYPGINSVGSAIAAYPAGTTFCIKAGIHRFTSTVVARTNDKYIGEPGAILNGSKVLTSFTRSGSYWVASGQTQREPAFPSMNGAYSVCVTGASACIYPEKVFLDGTDLWQVDNLAALSSGRFYFDYNNAQIYLADDPTGHTVEATTGSGGIIGYSGGSSDFVTVKNLVFEKFGGGEVAGSADNALKAVDGWSVENNEVRLVSYIGVANYGNGVLRNNYIHHNGKYGVVGGGTLEGNTISYNNTDGWDPNDDAGGTKFHSTVGLTLRGNTGASNTGRAFWTDTDNLNVTYENNILENNTEMGIFHEVSCAAVFRNNVLRSNNAAMAGPSLWWGGQIYIRSSKDVQIYGNDITTAGGGSNGISIRGGDAPSTGTNCGTIQLQNVSVHDNVLRMGTGDLTGFVGSGISGYSSTYNIAFANNTYYVPSSTAPYFWLDGMANTALNFQQWQGFGQDVTGTMH